MNDSSQTTLLTWSPSPHVKRQTSTKKIMINVCIALIPACVMGVVYFGLQAFLILALALFSAVASEFVFLLIAGKRFKQIAKQFDYTSCVTGLLVGMTIGTNYPWYAPIFGSAFAVIVVKMLFGGTGKNLANPAIVGRIFIFMSFQSVAGAWLFPSIGAIASGSGASVSTGATVLEGFLKGEGVALSNWDLLLGTGLRGCIGETCKVALIAGGIYLAARKIINPLYPIIYIAVEGLFAVCLARFDFGVFLPSILSGGLILGAIFMATDYVTTPNTKLGNVIYFIALGLLTAGLRAATKMEVVSFAILLMNLLVPLIDKFIVQRPFGYVKEKKIKAEKAAKNG